MADAATPWQPSKAAIMGHPIHPMLVPLPIGFLSGALATDVMYAVTRDRFWARASRMLLTAGATTGALAAPVGAVDFLGIRKARQSREGRIHAVGNVAALAITTANLLLRAEDEQGAIVPRGMAMTAVVAGLLVVTGWFGGELSYRKMVGVAGPQTVGTGNSDLSMAEAGSGVLEVPITQVDVERGVVGG